MSSLARQVLRNQIRVRGGGSFGDSKAMRRARRKMLKKVRPGDCTAPLNRRGPDGSYPMTTRLKRRMTTRLKRRGWSKVQFLQNSYDPTEGVR